MNEYQNLVKKVYQEHIDKGMKITAFEIAFEEAKQNRIPYSVFKTSRGSYMGCDGTTNWGTVENFNKFNTIFGN